MTVESKAYIIATKERPIWFIRDNGDVTDRLTEATIYSDPDEARREIRNFDEPENYTVIEGDIMFTI